MTGGDGISIEFMKSLDEGKYTILEICLGTG